MLVTSIGFIGIEFEFALRQQFVQGMAVVLVRAVYLTALMKRSSSVFVVRFITIGRGLFAVGGYFYIVTGFIKF